jgi:hypothetical protein
MKRLLLLFVMVFALFFVIGGQSSTQAMEDPDTEFCYTGWRDIGDGCVRCDFPELVIVCIVITQ